MSTEPQRNDDGLWELAIAIFLVIILVACLSR